MNNVIEHLAAATERSDLLAAIRSVRADGGLALALNGAAVRALREDEVRELTANGNTAEDWGRVRVAGGFRPDRVRHSDLRGAVVLGAFDGTVRGPDGPGAPAGVYRSRVSDCVIGHNAVVQNVGLLAGYVVGAGAFVSDCGRVVCDGPTAFGNGTRIPIGPQCGGRWLRPFAELTLDTADALTAEPAGPAAGRYAHFLADYLDRVRCDRGVIGAGAVVASVAVVRNAFVGPGAELDGATRVECATLLGSADEVVQIRDGACVTDSVLQWNVRVTGPAVVERSVLLESAVVERFGRVTDSVIGPNTTVGGAEVTASLVGPFVGCHHQGLLIAARWPGGRGNIGYGAGVGCNHTSRAPDQEAVLGEGLFVGLGAKVQYPVDVSAAPYTVLACGVTLPSQRIAFPFSLVRPPAGPVPGVPPGANVLIPGWVLSENLYALERSAYNFRARDRAPRHRLAHDVFRTDVMALVADARERLEHPAWKRDVYTEQQIPGLGRNVLLERDRVAAVRCYAGHLERLELLRLLDSTSEELSDGGLSPADRERVRPKLARLAKLLDWYGQAVERSKANDEERGQRVIDGYEGAHAPTRDDAVVCRTWEAVRATKDRITRVLAGLAPQAALVEVPLAGG